MNQNLLKTPTDTVAENPEGYLPDGDWEEFTKTPMTPSIEELSEGAQNMENLVFRLVHGLPEKDAEDQANGFNPFSDPIDKNGVGHSVLKDDEDGLIRIVKEPETGWGVVKTSKSKDGSSSGQVIRLNGSILTYEVSTKKGKNADPVVKKYESSNRDHWLTIYSALQGATLEIKGYADDMSDPQSVGRRVLEKIEDKPATPQEDLYVDTLAEAQNTATITESARERIMQKLIEEASKSGNTVTTAEEKPAGIVKS